MDSDNGERGNGSLPTVLVKCTIARKKIWVSMDLVQMRTRFINVFAIDNKTRVFPRACWGLVEPRDQSINPKANIIGILSGRLRCRDE